MPDRDEALWSPKPGDEWRGPIVKILILEVRDRLDVEPAVVFCAAHKDHDYHRTHTRTEGLESFIRFVGNGELIARKDTDNAK